jgi:hypothetical protein
MRLAQLEAEAFYLVLKNHLALFEVALGDIILMRDNPGPLPKEKFQGMLRDVKKWQAELYHARVINNA